MKNKIQWYKEVLELEPSSRVFFPFAKLLADNGRNAEALTVLRQGLEKHPEHIEAKLLLVDVLHRQGGKEELEEMRSQVLSLTGKMTNYPAFWQAWASILASDGEQHDSAVAVNFLAAQFGGNAITWTDVISRGLAAVLSGDGEAAIEAFSADYAFMIYGLLELYSATFNIYYLKKAIALQKQQIHYFWDDKNNGFFTSAHDQEQLLFQQKDLYDNATPSTNSMSAANLIRLARLTANTEFNTKAEKLTRSLAEHVKRAPTAFSYFLYAFYLTQQSKEVIIVGKQDAADSKKMLAAIRAKYLPHASILFKTEKNQLEKLVPFTKEYDMQNERATAFVCTNYSCQTPTHDIQKMLADLK